MSTCIINTNFSLSCKDSIGGLRTVYLASFQSGNIFTEDADGVITNMVDSTSGQITYYTYELTKETAGLEQAIEADPATGTTLYTQTLSLVFNKNTPELRNTLKTMAIGRMSAIALTQNGEYVLLGKVNAMNVTEGTVSTGTSYNDRNGTTLTLTGREASEGQYLDQTAFDGLNIV